MKMFGFPGEEMRKIVEDRDFGKLPDSMRIAGEEAYETLLHTGDGQLCDVIIDRAALDAIYQAGKESPDKIIQDYARIHSGRWRISRLPSGHRRPQNQRNL